MCGISGIVTRDGGAPRELLRSMCDALTHRGPDDAGDWWSDDGVVGLGHRRLAIIDLSPGGHQPMSGADPSVHITFNGEIYNFLELRKELAGRGHAFHTSSDTEVMLAAYREWGESFVERLRGMFAFALYDAAKSALFLARDRAGEKPLFYFRGDRFLVFGSELKSLFVHPGVTRRLDLRAVDAYLTYAYVPGELCMIAGARKVAPGTMVRIDVRTLEERVIRYWDVPTSQDRNGSSDDELCDELESLLADAVRGQLLASDVPVGVLLSGGVDSSIVTALAARALTRPVKTFTIAFPGHGQFDEGPYARLVASHFGTEHHELVAEPATASLMPLLARQYDEPMGDSSMIPTFLVSRMVRQQTKVALGGDGGDELFAGYPHYSFVIRELQLRRLAPAPLRRLAAAAASRLPVGTRGRNHLIGLGSDFARTIAHFNMYFDEATRRRLLVPDAGGWSSESLREGWARDGSSPLRQAMITDFKTYLPDDILVKVDRASMLTSLEVRAPFLDHRVIEFAFARVPDRLRATRGGRKLLLRKLAAKLLPKELDITRKQGFSIPIDRWFAGEFGALMQDVLMNGDDTIFDRRVIAELIAGQERGRGNANRLFILTMFELWRREYTVTL
jgi:asparagine synthase (glutamine-hydrolysing)